MYAQFPQHATPLFDQANLLLRKDESSIRGLHTTPEMQPQELPACFVKASVVTSIIRHVVKGGDHVSDRCKDRTNQLARDDLTIGQNTKEFITSHSGLHHSWLFKDVRRFYSVVVKYMLMKFPSGDELLVNAAVVDVKWRKPAPSNKFSILLSDLIV